MSVPVAKVKKTRVKKLPVPKPVEASVSDLLEKKFWLKVEEDPDLKSWLERCDKVFFYGKLTGRVEIRWNGQMTRCAGLTKYKRNRITREVVNCRVLLSSPLLKSNVANSNQFIETLLHELIHAYIAVEERLLKRECNKGHGPVFLSHMDRINKATGLEISVHHHLYSEMHEARPYWWACDGPCRLWPPYHGLIKKSNQGALTTIELAHHKGCPGTHHRVKVPDSTDGVNKEPKKKSKTAARPSLLVRRSLILPSPYTKRDVHICGKKRLVPASPRTAKAYHRKFVQLGVKVPTSALVTVPFQSQAPPTVMVKSGQPTVGVKLAPSSSVPALGDKAQSVATFKDKIKKSSSVVTAPKPNQPTVGLKPTSSTAPFLGGKPQHVTISKETTKTTSTALKKVPVITIETTPSPKKRKEKQPTGVVTKTKVKIAKGKRAVPVQPTRVLDETIYID